MPRGISQNCCCQCPCPHRKPLLTRTSLRNPLTLAGRSGSIPVGSLFLSFVSWGMILFLPSKSGVSVSPSPRSPAVKSLWPSKPDSLGILSPFVRSPVWENGCVAQNLHNSGKTSLVLFSSSLWLAYLVGMGFDFIIIFPLLPSHCGFSFVF